MNINLTRPRRNTWPGYTENSSSNRSKVSTLSGMGKDQQNAGKGNSGGSQEALKLMRNANFLKQNTELPESAIENKELGSHNAEQLEIKNVSFLFSEQAQEKQVTTDEPTKIELSQPGAASAQEKKTY